MRPPKRRYSVDQIVQATRWSWASSRGDDEPDRYFDGVAFWKETETGRAMVSAEAMPQEGWWHANDCHCELCRPSPLRPALTD
jgi:hypothetical protein